MNPRHPESARATVEARWRKPHGFTRRDWTGDCIITIAAGLVIVAGVALPWANDDTGHRVNLSLVKPDAIRPALATDWGVIVLALGVVVFALGTLMLAAILLVPTGFALAVVGYLLAGAATGTTR